MRFLAVVLLLIGFAFANASASANAKQTYQRVVLVGGDLTEIFYALDLQDKIVGNDTSSSYPKASLTLPKVGYKRALSVEGILSLKPDVIICNDDAGPQAVMKQLQESGVEIIRLNSSFNIAGVIKKIKDVADIFSVQDKAQHVIDSIGVELTTLEINKTSLTHTPRVMFILQHGASSPMVAGQNTAADGIINLSGGVNVVEQYHGYKILTAEAAIAYNPDVILITNETLEQFGSTEEFLKHPALSLTKAAKNKKVIAMDALFLLGFGPRTAQAALVLEQQY